MIDIAPADVLMEFDGDCCALSDYADAVEVVCEMGIDPREPAAAPPGSEGKVAILAARYAIGFPLWRTDDRPANIR